MFQCYVRYSTWQMVIVVSNSLSELICVGTVWSEYGQEVAFLRSILWDAHEVALRIEGNRYFQRGRLHGLPLAGRASAWRPLGRRTLEGISWFDRCLVFL